MFSLHVWSSFSVFAIVVTSVALYNFWDDDDSEGSVKGE